MQKILIVFLFVVGSALGNFFLKLGMNGISFNFTISSILNTFITVFQRPIIWAGLFFYGFAALQWLLILGMFPLYVASSLTSLIYIIAILISKFYFMDDISLLKWGGIFVIGIGVFIVTSR